MPISRRMTGYFTLFKWVRGQSLNELDRRIGYRGGRISAKGAVVYKFLRLPNVSEFEVRGTSIWTEQQWQKKVEPKRTAELVAVASYHRNTKVPSFDEVQK